MSLTNIQLPPLVLQELFRKSLVDAGPKPRAASASPGTLSWLGSNGGHIAIVVEDADALYLSEAELEFLMGILSACRLTMADVALVNLARNPGTDYKTLEKELNAAKIFLFGPSPAALELPIAFPYYQVQRYNNQLYLAAPALPALHADKMEKSKLWTCLKQIFSL